MVLDSTDIKDFHHSESYSGGTGLEGEEELEKKARSGHCTWGQLPEGGLLGQVASDWQVRQWSLDQPPLFLRYPICADPSSTSGGFAGNPPTIQKRSQILQR